MVLLGGICAFVNCVFSPSDRPLGNVVGLDEQGIVKEMRPKIWRVYERKNRKQGKNAEVEEREEEK